MPGLGWVNLGNNLIAYCGFEERGLRTVIFYSSRVLVAFGTSWQKKANCTWLVLKKKVPIFR